MTKYEETTKKDWIRTIIYIAVFVAISVIGAFFWLLIGWPIGFFIYFVLSCGALFLIV